MAREKLLMMDILSENIIKEKKVKLFGNEDFYKGAIKASRYNKISRQRSLLLEKYTLYPVWVPNGMFTKVVVGYGATAKNMLLFKGYPQDYMFLIDMLFQVYHKREGLLAPIRERLKRINEQTAFDLEQFEDFGFKKPKMEEYRSERDALDDL